MKLGILENKKFYLEYNPKIGGSIFKFQGKLNNRKLDIFRSFNKKNIKKFSSYFSGYFSTIPYFGAIKKKSFLYKDKYISLPRTHPLEPDTIHGEGWVNEWKVVNSNKTYVKMSFSHNGKKSFPYKYETYQSFRLYSNSLRIKVSILNKDNHSFDCGIGFHPWFNIHNKSKLFNNSYEYITLNNKNKSIKKKLLKNNKPFNLNKISIDESFINWNGKSKLILNDKIKKIISNKKNIKNFHIYSPKNENFFCVEPITNLRESYFFKKNNIKEHGLTNLKPGRKFEAIVDFKIIM